MGIKIKNVLISDAVDESCVKLLQENNINVTCLYKLTPEQLLEEIPVSYVACLQINFSSLEISLVIVTVVLYSC
jgi:hypothetical protein